LYTDTTEPSGPVSAEFPINTGRQHSFGVDVLILGEITETFSFRLWYSFLNARIKLRGDEYDVPKVSTHKAGLGITLRPVKGLCLDLRSRWSSGIHTQPDNPIYEGGRVKGDLIVDAHLSYRLPIEGFEFVADVRNLLNIDYYTAGAQGEDHRFGGSLPLIPQRPRELYLGFTYRY